jgi:hypothetical protein
MSRLGGVLLVAAALLVVPAPAGAETIGADLTQTINVGGAAPCGSVAGNPCSFLTVTKNSGDPETGSPIDGVLTSARVRTAGAATTIAVRVLHPDPVIPLTYLNLGPETLIPVTADAGGSGGHITEAAGLHHPISAGDRLGVGWIQPGAGVYIDASGGSPACLYRMDPDGAHAVDTSVTYNNAGCGVEFLVQGTVEADADHDGFGDVSQDQCPTSATAQGTCPVTTATPPPAPNKKCKKKKKHRSADASVAKKKCKKKANLLPA